MVIEKINVRNEFWIILLGWLSETLERVKKVLDEKNKEKRWGIQNIEKAH